MKGTRDTLVGTAALALMLLPTKAPASPASWPSALLLPAPAAHHRAFPINQAPQSPIALVAQAEQMSRVYPQAREAVESPDVLVARGWALARAYGYEEALALAEAAIRLDPLHIEGHRLLETLHSHLDIRAELEPRYRALVAAHPDSAAAYYLLSTVTRSSEQREAYLRHALQLDSTFGPARLRLARVWAGSRDAERAAAAVELARAAVAMMPGDYGAASTYVDVLMSQQQFAEARAFAREMVELYPDELGLWTQLWELEQLSVNRGPESLLAQINAQRHRFMDSMAHMEMLANALAWAGEEGRREAIALRRAIAERYPEHPRTERGLLTAMKLTEDLDLKLEILALLDNRNPGSPARYIGYQEILSTLIWNEQYDEAVELSKTLLTLPDPGFSERGMARDRHVFIPAFGRSFACIGHAGWFTAAQTSSTNAFRQPPFAAARGARSEPYDFLAILDAGIPIAPEAAAAARGLAISGCADSRAFLIVGQGLIHDGDFRAFGIELLERTIALYEQEGHDGQLHYRIDHYRELLPYLYLREDRLDDAVVAVEGLLDPAAGRRRSPMFFRIAGEVYETAGRLEDARSAYRRALRGTPRDIDFARRALARIHRALSKAGSR